MNVDTLITQVLARLDEVNPLVPIHWTRGEILVYVNEALSEMNLVIWEFQSTATLAITPSANVYDCPASMIAAIAVRDGKYLRQETFDSLDKSVPWESPAAKRISPISWAPLGLNKLIIYPRPHVAKSITVEGLIEHTPVTDSAMAIPASAEYESAIQDFCVERATFKEGVQELYQASSLYKEFLESIQTRSGRQVLPSPQMFAIEQTQEQAVE